jgi:hypothetical protein
MRSDAHSRNLRLHRLTDTSATFVITKSLHPKKPILAEVAREIVVNALAYAVQQERIYLRSFVVMRIIGTLSLRCANLGPCPS